MDKNVVLTVVKPYIGSRDLITFKSYLDKVSDEKAQEFVRRIPAMNGLKNPVLALMLCFVLLGLGRIYIKSYGFLAIELIIMFFFFISYIGFRMTYSKLYAFLFLASLAGIFIYFLFNVFTIMNHTRERNLEILLDELRR